MRMWVQRRLMLVAALSRHRMINRSPGAAIHGRGSRGRGRGRGGSARPTSVTAKATSAEAEDVPGPVKEVYAGKVRDVILRVFFLFFSYGPSDHSPTVRVLSERRRLRFQHRQF